LIRVYDASKSIGLRIIQREIKLVSISKKDCDVGKKKKFLMKNKVYFHYVAELL